MEYDEQHEEDIATLTAEAEEFDEAFEQILAKARMVPFEERLRDYKTK